MECLAEETVLAFLEEVGRRYSQPADLLLLGGSALCLLGSPRPTLDIDYVGDDLTRNELQQCIDQVAQNMGIVVEAVPISGFVPLPEDADQRKVSVGQFGAVQVYILDPYSMALSKVDRGFDSDFVAQALGHSIYTETNTWDELNTTLQDAVACHFGEEPRPLESSVLHCVGLNAPPAL